MGAPLGERRRHVSHAAARPAHDRIAKQRIYLGGLLSSTRQVLQLDRGIPQAIDHPEKQTLEWNPFETDSGHGFGNLATWKILLFLLLRLRPPPPPCQCDLDKSARSNQQPPSNQAAREVCASRKSFLPYTSASAPMQPRSHSDCAC
jgi:hypothetical protein